MTDQTSINPVPPTSARTWEWHELVRRLRSAEEFWFVVSIFVASRVLVLLISVAGPSLVPRGLFSPGLASTTTWRAYWVRWDAGWYITIARRGYEYNMHDASSVAFFPLFPMLMRSLGWLGLDLAAAGILISNACFFAGLWVLHRFVQKEFGRPQLAGLAISFMAFGPAALWCSVGYSEALYFLLAVAFCRALWSKNPGWGVILGLLVGLTRSNAITLALPALVLVWPMVRTAWQARSRGRLVLLGFAAFSPWIGYLLYAGYLQFAFGDWRANQTTSLAGWGTGLSFDPALLLTKLPGKGLRLFWASDTFHEYVAWSWFVALAASGFAFIAFGEARAPRWYIAFILGFWGFFAFAYQYNEPLASMGRYISLAFPLYVAGALFAERRPWARPALLAISVVAMSLTTLSFFAGYHIN
jgi:hypothetical protein